MIRFVLRITAVLAVLVLVALVIVWTHLGRVGAAELGSDVERTGEVTCEVGNLSIKLLRGTAELENLVVYNPPRYPETDMLNVTSANFDLRAGELFSRPTHIDEIRIPAATVRVESGPGKSNVLVYLTNVMRNTLEPAVEQTAAERKGAEAKPAEQKAEREAEGKPLIIDRLVVDDATVSVGAGFGKAALPVRMRNIVLTDIRGPAGEGITSGELTALLVMHLVRGAAEELKLEQRDFIPTGMPDRFGKAATLGAGMGAEPGAGRVEKIKPEREPEAAETPAEPEPAQPAKGYEK